MTVKTLKLQLERTQGENAKLKKLIKVLEEKVDILEDTINKLKALNKLLET